MNPEQEKYIVDFLHSMEVGKTDPYRASFAGGKSGLSFGNLQNDVANNPDARKAFQTILESTASTTGLTGDQIAWVVDKASKKGVVEDDFRKNAPYGDLIPKINQALHAGSDLVDTQDKAQARHVFVMVQGAFAAAAANENGPGELDPASPNLKFVAELAEWGNRTGGLAQAAAYLRTAPGISQSSFERDYLSKRKQFATGGEHISRWQQRLNDADTYARAAGPIPAGAAADAPERNYRYPLRQIEKRMADLAGDAKTSLMAIAAAKASHAQGRGDEFLRFQNAALGGAPALHSQRMLDLQRRQAPQSEIEREQAAYAAHRQRLEADGSYGREAARWNTRFESMQAWYGQEEERRGEFATRVVALQKTLGDIRAGGATHFELGEDIDKMSPGAFYKRVETGGEAFRQAMREKDPDERLRLAEKSGFGAEAAGTPASRPGAEIAGGRTPEDYLWGG